MKTSNALQWFATLATCLVFSWTAEALEWKYEWTSSFGSLMDEDVKGLDVDTTGNIYVVGSYNGDFDGNLHRGGGDVYVRKYSPSGAPLWTRTFGGSTYDIVSSIRVDSSRDNVLIGGAFTGIVDFDPSPDSEELKSVGEAMYLLNLSSDGSFKWVKVLDAPEGVAGGGGIADIALDDGGNIYYCGLFGSDIAAHGKIDFNPNIGTHIIQSTGRTDLFVSKMDAAGNYIWTYTYGVADTWTAGLSLQTYPGRVYVTGGTGGGGGESWYSGDSYRAAFVVKLTDLGSFQWRKDIEEFYSPASVNLMIDKNEDVYVCGVESANTRNTLRQIIPSLSAAAELGTNLFVKKHDPLGNPVWTYATGGWGTNGAYSMALNKNNDIYLVGEFQGRIDFNPNGKRDIQNSHGATKDIFITKLSTDGSYNYTMRLGGWQGERAQKVLIDPYRKDLYVAGFFSGGFNFSFAGGTDWHQSNGRKDAFVSRYSHINQAPKMSGPPIGPGSGTVGTGYKFTAKASDPDGDPIKYRFKWGDGKQTVWNSVNVASHRWKSPGMFCVRAQAQDDNGSVSKWSDCSTINVE